MAASHSGSVKRSAKAIGAYGQKVLRILIPLILLTATLPERQPHFLEQVQNLTAILAPFFVFNDTPHGGVISKVVNLDDAALNSLHFTVMTADHNFISGYKVNIYMQFESALTFGDGAEARGRALFCKSNYVQRWLRRWFKQLA